MTATGRALVQDEYEYTDVAEEVIVPSFLENGVVTSDEKDDFAPVEVASSIQYNPTARTISVACLSYQPSCFSKHGFYVAVACVGVVVAFVACSNLASLLDHRNPTIQKEAAIDKITTYVQGTTGRMHSSWNKRWVKKLCRGIVMASERRLLTERLDDDVDNSRNLLKKAEFNITLLHLFDLRGKNNAWMPYYGSADIEKQTPNNAKTAIIVVHGAARDAQNYFCAFADVLSEMKHARPDKALLIALKFHYEIDDGRDRSLYWNTSKPWGDYRGGASSDEDSWDVVSSFSVLDKFIRHLTDDTKFPLMKELLIVGHSGGGQLVHRYAVLSHLPPDSRVRFVVMNPSSYAYLNTRRWIYDCKAGDVSCSEPIPAEYDPKLGRNSWSDKQDWGFNKVDTATSKKQFVCRDTTFNDWHYGLNWERIGTGDVIQYMRAHPNLEAAVEHYKQRDVIYVVGQNDTCTDNMLPFCDGSCWMRNDKTMPCYRTYMDMRCPAMLQGPNRNQRGKNYMRHLKSVYGKSVHRLMEVEDTGHQGAKMFQARKVVVAMFAPRH